MGELFEPFTRVAGGQPVRCRASRQSAAELVEFDRGQPADRRPVPAVPGRAGEGQPGRGGADDAGGDGAAVRHPGRRRWVFLHGHADLRERDLLDRADLSAGPASVLAARRALAMAGIAVADLATIDLYSCFPIAVFNICDGLPIAPDDRRGLTLTGGLPFFGGAGNNYSMHAIAETVQRGGQARARSASSGPTAAT